MEKQEYTKPRTEVLAMTAGGQIMRTSVPAPPDGMPQRRPGDLIE